MPNQGGSHDQHVKAGQQSHKGTDTKQASSKSDDKDSRSDNRGSSAKGGSKSSDGRKSH
jgi:hypothetical protein